MDVYLLYCKESPFFVLTIVIQGRKIALESHASSKVQYFGTCVLGDQVWYFYLKS